METRKITVEEVTHNRSFTTTSGFKIEYFKLKDTEGDIYEFSSNMIDQKKFIGGRTYEVTVETKQNRGGDYLFIDLSQGEKDRQKLSKVGPDKNRKYYRSRQELLSIVSQSSYEAAVMLCKRFAQDKIKIHTSIASISKVLTTFIVESSELDSDACKKEDPAAMRVANDKSIVYQKALKLAIECLDLPNLVLEDGTKVENTQTMISLTEEIFADINKIATGL